MAPQAGDPLGEVGSELAVHVSVGEGTVHVWEGIAADVGDAPGESCGAVAGRPATIHEVLGGVLVQWSDQGWWYGIFSLDVPRSTLVEVARAMTPQAAAGP